MPVRFLTLLAAALLVALVPHLLWGPLAGAVVALGWTLGWAALQLQRAKRLERWLKQPEGAAPDTLGGLWGDLADRLRRLLSQRDRQVQEHAERLQYFLRALQASPNGVTLLDAQGRIESLR